MVPVAPEHLYLSVTNMNSYKLSVEEETVQFLWNETSFKQN